MSADQLSRHALTVAAMAFAVLAVVAVVRAVAGAGK